MKIQYIKYALATVLCAFVLGCAQVPLNKVTQSGKPERVFANTKVVDIKSKLIDRCATAGLQIDDRGSNSVVCSKTLSGGDAVIAQIAIGNSYSTTPEQKVSFSITQRGNDVFVIATSMWIETQMAFGQMRRQDIANNKQINDVQNFLDSIR